MGRVTWSVSLLPLQARPGLGQALTVMLDILAITGPIYLVIAIGYGVTRQGLFSKGDMRAFGTFVVRLALPALLFNALTQRALGDILRPDYLLAYALVCLGLAGVALWWARRGRGLSWSASANMAMGMSCSNSGFVGYPIALLTLGAPVAGVSLALNMLVENLLLLPLLMAVADAGGTSGQWREVLRQTLRGLLTHPMILAIAAGLGCSMLGLQLPGPLARTVTLFAQASGVLSLLVIGGTLVGLQVGGLRAQVAQISLGKLVCLPALAWAVLMWVVPVHDPALRTALLLTTAMPMMGVYPILAQKHGHEGVSAAALLVCTVASFFTLSALLWALRVVGWMPV